MSSHDNRKCCDWRCGATDLVSICEVIDRTAEEIDVNPDVVLFLLLQIE
jgi:hypothetical protein